MKVLLLLCFIAYGYGAVVDRCAQGQAHWCTSLRAAKQCGAVQHCIDNVWIQQAPYKADTGDVCKFCENVIGDVRNLFNNKTEAQIAGYLDAACKLCPVADKCRQYVKGDLPELFQCIRSKLNPGAVCSAIELCASYKDFTLQPEPFHRVALVKSHQDMGVRVADLMPLAVPASTTPKPKTTTPKPKTTTHLPDVCADCEKLFKDIKFIITDKNTKGQVEAYLTQNVCAHLGPIDSECVTMVKEYIPELLEMIADQVDPKMMCGALGLCRGGDRALLPRMRLAKSPLFLAASKLEGTEECDSCKVILSEVQNLDRNKVLQKDIEDLLKNKLCPVLGSLKQECMTTVDSYGQFLFEFLANELDPTTRCESLGFCSASNAIKTRKYVPTRSATPAHKPATNSKQSVQCVVCEFVMDKLEAILMNNSTEAEIVAVLDKVCTIMPDTIKEECNTFIKTYGPAIIDLLLQELSPKVVCTTLGLCVLPSSHKPMLLIHENAVLKMSETCGVCEMVVHYLNAMLEQNATEAQIKTLLDKVCHELPIGKECEEFVTKYTPQIIQLITQLADPKKLCTELGLCHKIKVSLKKPLLGADKCTYGPAYWCSSHAKAKKCGAVAHCEKHGWAKPLN